LSKPRVLLSWSSGKDSAWALHTLRQQGEVEVVALLTTLNRSAARVAMHAVRDELLDRQAQALGLPVWKVLLPWPCPNEEYEAMMTGVFDRARREGIDEIAYGDLFLGNIRAYREACHAVAGIGCSFPLWGIPTDALARSMIAAGLQATITCVDPRQLDPRFVGRAFDLDLLAELPDGVDPCGERGEFHTFAHAGPMFSAPIAVSRGDVVERDGFVFADLLPA
jgi:uncharacterized protein (TIGR00290 family)